MAAHIYKIWVKQLLWQSAMLLSLHFQLYGIISILNYTKQNKILGFYYIYHARQLSENIKRRYLH